jgi:hypothetical protein
MNFLYIISKTLSNQYLFDFTTQSSQTLFSDSGIDIHLYIPCINQEEIINRLKEINMIRGQYGSYDLKKLILYCLENIKTEEPSPQPIESNVIMNQTQFVQVGLQSESPKNMNVEKVNENSLIVQDYSSSIGCTIEENSKLILDIKDNLNETNKINNLSKSTGSKIMIEEEEKKRLGFLENISFKIAEENHQVNNILNKLNTFRTNISKANKNLDSLRKYKYPVSSSIPQVIQSERPRSMVTDSKQEIITVEDCRLWVKNKLLNPKTGRKIDENGPTYKKFQMMTKMYKL